MEPLGVAEKGADCNGVGERPALIERLLNRLVGVGLPDGVWGEGMPVMSLAAVSKSCMEGKVHTK